MDCIECGEELLAERAELGYRYCTKKRCHEKHRRGTVVTAVAVNKSGDSFIVADSDEIRKRAEAGEFATKNTRLPVSSDAGRIPPAPRSPAVPTPRAKRRSTPRSTPTAPARTWTAQQEKLVRLYHDMGLSPRQIVERAHRAAPRLGITEALATRVLSSPPRREAGTTGARSRR